MDTGKGNAPFALLTDIVKELIIKNDCTFGRMCTDQAADLFPTSKVVFGPRCCNIEFRLISKARYAILSLPWAASK